ncbi:hypothetical protein FB645_004971 [Coemansia sp. IMI 203386]|nr:hypothetical protein FB645_004971 [Coemansia sp. IMI 203386]
MVGLRENKCIPERFSRKTPKEKAIPKPKSKSVFNPKPKPKRIPIAKRKLKTRPRRNPGREYKRKEKRAEEQ